MVGIELRRERSTFIPERRITNRNRSVASDGPGLLVELFNGERVRTGKGLDSLCVSTKIAYLIKGVPGGHLHDHFVFHVRNLHRDMEYMLLRGDQRNLIADRRTRRAGSD